MKVGTVISYYQTECFKAKSRRTKNISSSSDRMQMTLMTHATITANQRKRGRHLDEHKLT